METEQQQSVRLQEGTVSVAWQQFEKAFEILTLQSINEKQCRPLKATIRIWGEELVKQAYSA